ncbi:MAG: energy transducer TonB [Pseudomonadota bacterium]
MKRSILCAVFTALVSAASAEVPNETIAAFNEAKSGGNLETIKQAASDLGAAAVAETDDPNRALLAFEAAWTLCQVDACDMGRPYAALADSLPVLDDYPSAAERNMLLAYIDWTTDKTGRTRDALETALEEIAPLEVSLISIAAFSDFVGDAINEGRWSRLEDRAGLAAKHYEKLKPVLPLNWAEMALAEQIGAFNHSPKRHVVGEVLKVRGELAALLREADNDTIEAAQPFRWRLEAWEMAMNAYFVSKPGERAMSDSALDSIRDEYPDFPTPNTDENSTLTEDDDETELCEGELDMSPKLRYPGRAAFRGQFGSVVVTFALNEGKVEDLEVLAAVPSEGFEDVALRTVSQWTWVKDENKALPGCSMSRSNIVMPLVFQLG